MLNMCVSHIACCGFNFSIKKTVCCLFSNTVVIDNETLFLYYTSIKVDKSFDYFGITFLSNNGITICLEAKIRKFYFAISSVLRFKYDGIEK